MENKDFNKIFAHKFKQVPGEPYDEANWSDLSRRLVAYERRKRRWVLPVLLSLLALLTAGNVFWWYQWSALTRNNRPEAARISAVLQTDTIVHKTVVYRYDTIYQNITLLRRYDQESGRIAKYPVPQEKQPGSLFSEQQPTSAMPGRQQVSPANRTTTALETDEAYTQKLPENNTEQSTVNKQHTEEYPEKPGQSVSHPAPLADTSSLLRVSALATTPPKADSVLEEIPAKQQMIPKLSTPLFSIARPRLNVSAGWGNPLLEHKRSGYLLGVGMGADVEIMPNVRLGADVHYWNGALQADETEELLGVEIPNPGNDYKLKYWETYELSTFSYALFLRYQIPIKKNWKPWIGIGTQAATYLPYELEFDFENQNTELEIFIPSESVAVTHWHGLMAMAGFEGRISPHFSLGAEAYLLGHLAKKPGIIDNQIGLKTRLYYSF